MGSIPGRARAGCVERGLLSFTWRTAYGTLFWDAGRGFERAQANSSAWIVLIATVVLTAALLVAAVSLRSPLGRVLGSGSAKEGTDHWWLQRVTRDGTADSRRLVPGLPAA